MAGESSDRVCIRCGETTPHAESSLSPENVYCRRCTLELAGEIVADAGRRESERKERLEGTAKKRGRSALLVRWAILVTCAALLAWRLPAVGVALQKERPLRMGTYATDAVTDACIENLWRISGEFRSGRGVPPDLTCPSSGKPYRETDVDGEPAAFCPSPERHGLTLLRVSRSEPVPEVR